jgi:hypothetical protein
MSKSNRNRQSSNHKHLETLENRQLFAASAAVVGGVLKVEGTTLADRIVVEPAMGTIQLANSGLGGSNVKTPIPQYRVRVLDANGTIRNGADGKPMDKSFLRSAVSRVEINAGNGNDEVYTDKIAIPTKALLGGGDDIAWTGSGSDSIYGDAGKDKIFAGAGRDYVYGGDGDDSLYGQGGNDMLYGEAGNDRLFGGAGIDVLDGGAGSDWLEAGSASEEAYGGVDGNAKDFNAYQWSVDGTDRDDVKQGRAHTCSLMSTLAAASYQGIDLTSRISYLGNYEYNVMLYNPAFGYFMPHKVKFDGTMLIRSSDNKVVDPVSVNSSDRGASEFWTVLYQRAYLKYFQNRDITSVDSVMSFTSDSDPSRTMKIVLGKATSTELMPWFAEDLKGKLDNGQVVNAGGTGHRYAVLEVYKNSDGKWMVRLYNPRAYDGTHNDMPIEAVGSSDGKFNMTWSNFTNSEYFTNYTFSR